MTHGYDELACRRCQGTGRLKQDSRLMASVHKRDALSALRSAVGSGKLLLTEDPLPVRVLERGNWSICERVGQSDDHHAVEMRKPGRITLQGGFPKSKDGLYFVFVDPDWPEPGFGLLDEDFARCRWCAGDGLHPFVPHRHRQILKRYVEAGDGCGVTVCMGVGPVRPLLDYLQITAQAGIDILARYGLDLARLRCPRCDGSGSPVRRGIAIV